MQLYSVPDLITKTQNPSILEFIFQEFIIPSLTDFMNGDREEMLLYHIRTIRKYLSWIEQYCPACTNLFVSVIKRKKWVSQNIISFWWWLLVSGNYAVQQVLKAGIWSSKTTFSIFYLRDVTHRYMDTSTGLWWQLKRSWNSIALLGTSVVTLIPVFSWWFAIEITGTPCPLCSFPLPSF